MAEKRTQIKIPERRDDEPPASPRQLERIRQLVSGMSLQGYRFDYRKMGAAEAEAVIQQLTEQRREQGLPEPARKQSAGCVGAFVSGTVRLIVSLLVIAAVAAGAYAFFTEGGMDLFNQLNSSQDTAEPNEDAAASRDQAQQQDPDDGLRDSSIFSGLSVRDDPPEDDPQPDPNPNRITDPQPDPPTITPDPTPPANAQTLKQLAQLEELLVKLSQFTREDYSAGIRQQSTKGMQASLGDLSKAMQAIESADAQLANRIQAVVSGYAAAQIDGPAIRTEIDAIREKLSAIRSSLE